MRHFCGLCGKPTKPFVMIGQVAIGPKCAKKAGLNPKKLAKTKAVFLRHRPSRPEENQTLPLFEGLEVQS